MQFISSMYRRAGCLMAATVLAACQANGEPAEPDAGGATTGDAGRDGPVVETDRGPVRGTQGDLVDVWKGIPYAKAPVGPLRWAPPVAPERWTDARDASAFGSVCPQLDEDGSVVGDEDCLSLNVWAPADRTGEPMPVILFIHGGSWIEGASESPLYDGGNLAARGPAVVVTINYRLGALGYLALPELAAEQPTHTTGNYGLLDQVAALEWVQRNVAGFGGDPDRVLVWGQSAGAWSVLIHQVSPLSTGLFSRGFAQSGATRVQDLAFAQASGASYADDHGCSTVACLRALPVAAAVDGSIPWGPTIDGHVLTQPIMKTLLEGPRVPVPTIIGTTANEFANMKPNPPVSAVVDEVTYEAAIVQNFGEAGAAAILERYPASAFDSPRAAYIAVLNDGRMTCPNRRIARALAAADAAPTWRYLWKHRDSSGPFRPIGPAHASDLRYWFANFHSSFSPQPDELELADSMVAYVTSFAATGDPNRAGLAVWPAYDETRDPTLILDIVPAAPTDGYRPVWCDVWDSLVQ
jgi:para-nitrobenzyl esterase